MMHILYYYISFESIYLILGSFFCASPSSCAHLFLRPRTVLQLNVLWAFNNRGNDLAFVKVWRIWHYCYEVTTLDHRTRTGEWWRKLELRVKKLNRFLHRLFYVVFIWSYTLVLHTYTIKYCTAWHHGVLFHTE